MKELEEFAVAYKVVDAALEAGEAHAAALPAAKEALNVAVGKLLVHVSSQTGNKALCEEVDVALCTFRGDGGKYTVVKASGPLLKPAVLKSSLLAALKSCSSYPALLALPQLMETTRKLLCEAPAKGVEKYLCVELCNDMDSCTDARTLAAVQDVLRVHMQGEGRFKKDLMGFTLSAGHQKSVRTAANRAAKVFVAVTEAGAAAAKEAAKTAAALAAKEKAAAFVALQEGGAATAAETAVEKPQFEMPEGSMRDMRLEDAERAAALAAGTDALFDQALAKKGKKKGGKAGDAAPQDKPAEIS